MQTRSHCTIGLADLVYLMRCPKSTENRISIMLYMRKTITKGVSKKKKSTSATPKMEYRAAFIDRRVAPIMIQGAYCQ